MDLMLRHQTILGGTHSYMPPEQMTGAADHRADIFALGATFYELLTGKLPGKDGLPANMARDYPTPRDLLPSVPDNLSQLIMRCLQHEPSNRVQDVPTLQKALREVRSALEAIEHELRAFLSEKGN